MVAALVFVVFFGFSFVSMETTTEENCFSNETCGTITTTETTINITETETGSSMNETTAAPLTTTEIPLLNEETTQVAYKGCFCDLQRDFCDINCCCDSDCNYENKLAFSHCKMEEDRYVDTNFCDYMEYIYKNNTLYEWEINQNGLFCIVKSNLPPQYTIQQKTEIKTLQDAELQTTNKYLWPSYKNKNTTQARFNFTEKFVHGKFVWFVKNNVTLQKFQLPNQFLTNMCGKMQDIKFLENFKSKCAQFDLSEKNEALNPETYFKNLTIISVALRVKNVTNAQKCPKDICIPFSIKLCHNDDFVGCRNLPQSSNITTKCRYNVFNNEKECLFLTQKIRYNIYHNGTQGIKSVDLFLVVKNATVELSDSKKAFYQNFEVSFFWTNHTFNYSSFLSGNPGYKTEKPIIIGTLVTLLNITNIPGTNLTESKQYYKIMRNSNDVTKNFLVFPKNKNGFCVLNNNSYTTVDFGFNSIFKCRFVGFVNATQSHCKNIQKYIFDQWSVIYENHSRVVGRFGNANSNNIGEWVKILQNKQPSDIINATSGFPNNICKTLVSKLSITIFHSRVDTKFYANQEKIVGVSYKFGVGEDFDFVLQNGRVAFDIPARVDVVFVDTTKPKIQKFVDPPTFKIRLPYDFFYPFIKIHNKASEAGLSVVLIVVSVFVNCFVSQ